jgi:hypothetical protein
MAPHSAGNSHVLRREARAFRPHVVLGQLIHNDFDESYRFLKTRYASSFFKIGFKLVLAMDGVCEFGSR